MATSHEYAEYVCDQLNRRGRVTCRMIFGEYIIYSKDNVLGLICDNQVFLKPAAAEYRTWSDVEQLPPYQGAKPFILLDGYDDPKEVRGSL